ncbi:class B sortase [Anoxybacterium hadale]|uniref:class B sortase n=1 Tax=Anoxybacterium hadale TaxID=3408580 RepID=UPI003AFF68E4
MGKKRKYVLPVFFLVVFAVSSLLLLQQFTDEFGYRAMQERLKAQTEKEQENAGEGLGSKDEAGGDDGSGRAILPRYREIYENNREFAGWISIADTTIDYPVMKPETDNDYYLTHSPEGRKSKYGAIYLDVKSDLNNEKTNYLIYGHYFRDGSMFGSLQNYKEENYFTEHPYIKFDTIYEEGTYEILAVFLSKVYQKNQDVFKYYQYTDITTQKDFETYVSEVKKLALYDTGVDAEYGDSLITLSTCDYWTENGRIAVVARKVTKK